MDIKKLTSDINKWRIEHQDNRYIREQILLNLKEEAGISTDITNWLIPHLFVTTNRVSERCMLLLKIQFTFLY